MVDWATTEASDMDLEMRATWNTAVIAQALRRARDKGFEEGKAVKLPDWDKLTSKQKDYFDVAMTLFFKSKTNLSTTWAALQHLADNP